MKAITAVAAIFLISGCSQKNPDRELVGSFWTAALAHDVATLQEIIMPPEYARMFASDTGMRFTFEDFEVLASEGDAVNVRFSRFCYPDSVAPTILATTGDGKKVDVKASIRAITKALADVETTRKYCYDFADQVLQGFINGKPWRFHHLDRQNYDFGTYKQESLKLVADACPDKYCLMLKTPGILIDNLDLAGEGGNLGNEQNLTIHTPPGDNLFVTTGSYRVTKTASGKTRLEISFRESEENYLNGYAEF